ncbi:MAG: beta-lactamase family protein [Flavobacteriaceae bacterium]|nr:beta-lactamase family protein [Flavobacteriaceae bacterium]
MKKSILLAFISILFISSCQTIDTTTQKKIAEAKEVAAQFLTDHHIPGMSISVAQNGQLIWSEGFGYSNIETQTKVLPNRTQFRIASISKTITAGAMAILVDQNKLNFDESIYTYIPDYPKKKYDFTVRQVAGHIAGIRHYKKNEFLMNKKMTIVEGLDIFKNDSLKFQPGSKFAYSTYGWNLLSVVVQNASNMEFNKYMETALFTPLQMHNTTLGLSDATMPNRTQFYYKTKADSIVLGPTVSNEHKVAGGGFISTSEDLLKFGNEILKPTIISKASIKELLTGLKTTDGKDTNYGIGFGIRTSKDKPLRYSHSGGGVGATTFLLMYPNEGLVFSIVTNSSGVPIRKIVNKLESIFVD